AYLVGSALGRHPLCKRLSPKKSQEGFWGGMAFCILAGAVYASAFAHNEFLTWATFGIIICLASTAGDLFESMMKRAGNLIPGHGGVLDRIDSLLMAAPAAALFALARLLAQVC
ncbi:MAG TPA: phosphatidate cytidylyltransferase, partial [Muribaculaceae bacterium]|nr:phosphatidate cytidylyltransferase [Muribaculaceae bacterium]